MFIYEYELLCNMYNNVCQCMHIYMFCSFKNPYSKTPIRFNKIVRRNTQETVRNKHSVCVIRATVAFYVVIRLIDEYFKPTLGFREH